MLRTPQAGSAVSDLLDERLRRLQQQLAESQKSCEGLVGQVDAFTKNTREMCCSAGIAAKSFGAALHVDSARKIETFKPAAAASAQSTSEQGSGADSVEEETVAVAAAATAAAAAAAAAAVRRKSGSLGSREPVRAELLAIQLNECASEMADHLQVQVVQPVQRMLSARRDVQVGLECSMKGGGGREGSFAAHGRRNRPF